MEQRNTSDPFFFKVVYVKPTEVTSATMQSFMLTSYMKVIHHWVTNLTPGTPATIFIQIHYHLACQWLGTASLEHTLYKTQIRTTV